MLKMSRKDLPNAIDHFEVWVLTNKAVIKRCPIKTPNPGFVKNRGLSIFKN